MTRHRDQAVAALRAIAIRGETRYSWLGRTSRALRRPVVDAMDDAERRRYLAMSVRNELYVSFYRHGMPVPARWDEPEASFADPAFLARLAAANTGRGSRDPGWTVERVDDGRAVVTKGGIRVVIAHPECRADGHAPGLGATVSLPLPKHLPALSPGFLTVIGDHAADHDPAAECVRVYWNVTPAGAPDLVHRLATSLNARGVAFRLKVVDHPGRFDRRDVAVLYVPPDGFADSRDLLGSVAEALGVGLRAGVPAFTCELAPGVGAAEDDDATESFGMRRCELLARAVIRAHDEECSGLGRRLELVEDEFAGAGLRLDAPYRAPAFAGRHVI